MTSSFDKAESIARAVLYEGYMLYPYRASAIKNRQRCTFGTLFPAQHPDVLRGAESCRHQMQCLVNAAPSSMITLACAFFNCARVLSKPAIPPTKVSFYPVDALAVGSEIHQSSDEAVERTVETETQLGELLNGSRMIEFEFPPDRETSELRDPAGTLAGRIRKTQPAVRGELRLSLEPLHHADTPQLYRLTAEVTNATPCAPTIDRETALLSSFASAHTIVSVRQGEFVSLLDPPDTLRQAAAECKNIGVYPVLVGEPGEHDIVLASPIILYDYPQIAPESAGDFFDATEIDELLTLRIMTLTDAEKSEMRNSDERLRELLARTEATAREQLTRTHGALRSPRPAP